MNVFWREMKACRKSMLGWFVGIIAMVAAGMGKYAGMSESGGAMNELLAGMPKALQAVMGVGELDVSTLAGYYGMLYLYLVLMGAVHAAMLGSGIVAKEERDGTAEFLLTKPISRAAVLTSKLLAGLAQIVLFNLVMLASSVAVALSYPEGGEAIRDMAALMAGMLLVQLLFAGVGAAVAAASRRANRAAAISAGVMVVTFMLSVAIDMERRLEVLAFASPFQYFKADAVLRSGLSAGFAALALAATAALVSFAYAAYARRDMRI